MTIREARGRHRTGEPAARSAAGSPRRFSRPGPGLLARRPELVPVAATAAAWLTLAVVIPVTDRLDGSGASTGADTHHAHGGLFTPAGFAMVAVMCVAMMGLLAIPGVRYVAANSPWWRTGRSICWFFGAFLAMWTVIAVCLQPLADLLAGVIGSASVAAGLLSLACALAQLDPRRAARTSNCDCSIPLRANGSDASTDSARFGLLCAARGFWLCALPMLTMLALPASLLVMALLTAFTVIDRFTAGHRRYLVAALYSGLGAMLLI